MPVRSSVCVCVCVPECAYNIVCVITGHGTLLLHLHAKICNYLLAGRHARMRCRQRASFMLIVEQKKIPVKIVESAPASLVSQYIAKQTIRSE